MAQFTPQPQMSLTQLHWVVGIAAIVAPALHSLSDLLEWMQGGLSPAQLWVTYAAFLPMPWLLLGIFALHDPKPKAMGLAGALLYGAAFSYFTHSALYALAEDMATTSPALKPSRCSMICVSLRPQRSSIPVAPGGPSMSARLK